jgi:hypothetical protein
MTILSYSMRAVVSTLVTTCFIFVVAVSLVACCGGASQPMADAENTSLADTSYEVLPKFKASDLLPADMLKSEHHDIAEKVENDGYENRYTIVSDYGAFEAHRTDFVEERVREVYALEELTKVTRSEAFPGV